MIIIPEVNTVYQFKFKIPFNIYDGIYRVHQLLTYDQFVSLNVDLYKLLYEDAEKTEEDYNDDMITFRTDQFIKLTKPHITIQTDIEKLQEKIYYIPKSLLLISPNPNVKAYSDLVVALHVGPIKDADKLDYIVNNIKENVLYATGINDDPKLASMSIRWLSDDEYTDIENSRELNKKQVVNYFSESQRLRRQIASLEAELLAYKKAINDFDVITP
jgi:hypothetical protein